MSRRKKTTCKICSHATTYGSWPSDHKGTHCRDCHRSWAALAQSHCTLCHRHFGSDKAGDVHRVHNECRDPKGFDKWDTAQGVIFGGRNPATSRAWAARVASAARDKTTNEGSLVEQGTTEHAGVDR